MEFRPIELPRDFGPVGEMIFEAFQYPENPGWSVQTDEQEELSHAIRTFQRLWILFRLAQIVSPPLRDMFRGYVAVEDRKVVGLTLVQRRGSTSAWVVGTVGVLPDFRRRGLAREGLEKSLEMMRTRGATKAWLGVIDGNTPAQRLYASLGFEVYAGTGDYTLTDPVDPSVPSLPAEYSIAKLKRSDWRTRLDLEKRIAPEETRRYEPIEKGRFRKPPILRLLIPIVNLVQRCQEEDFVLRETASGRVIGRFGYNASKRGKGVNSIRVHLDPATPDLARYVVASMLHKVVSLSPALRVELGVPRWMPAVAEAAESYGFEKRVEYLKMGRML